METSFHYKLREAQKSLLPVTLSIYLIEGCKGFSTVSTGSTVKVRLRLAEKIVNATRFDGFFALVVAS